MADLRKLIHTSAPHMICLRKVRLCSDFSHPHFTLLNKNKVKETPCTHTAQDTRVHMSILDSNKKTEKGKGHRRLSTTLRCRDGHCFSTYIKRSILPSFHTP